MERSDAGSDRGRVPFLRGKDTVLVLTRKTNESIMIGDEVEISVLSVAGDKVRLGIDAPREVEIFRKEVYHSREADEDREAGK